MKNNDAIQARNVVWTTRDIEAMQKDAEEKEEEDTSGEDEVKQRAVKKLKKHQRNKSARFRLSATVAINDFLLK